MKLVNGRTFTEIYLSAEGRLNNWEYFLYTALGCIIYTLLIKILEYIETFVPQYVLGLSTGGLAIFWLVCRIFLGIKRCHDLGHSGARLLWYLCPIFNIIFPFILYFEKGDKTENKYGKSSKVFSKRIKIITIFAVIIRRLCVGYFYYTIFSDLKNKIPEITQEINQNMNQDIQYETSTQEELIEAFGSENIDELSNYKIPKDMLENNPDLIELVIGSMSLQTKAAKQQRFDLYPLMDDEQKENLRDILTREKEKLAEIEEKYPSRENTEIEIENEDTISE